MRVSDEDVRSNLDGVLDTILVELNLMAETSEQAGRPSPQPSPRVRGEGVFGKYVLTLFPRAGERE